MSTAIFNYNGKQVVIQCSFDEEMKDICKKYCSKENIDITKTYFVYNGNKIDKEINCNLIINEEDRKRNVMNILVEDNDDKKIVNKNTFQSTQIICPKCKEPSLIQINNYKIKLYNCKNLHTLNNLLINKYEDTQNIDGTKIICDICKIKNKSNAYNNQMQACLNCNINLCPICKTKHDKLHKIILYEEKNYICNKHFENFTKYCNDCQLNICIKCEEEHKSHNSLYYGEILPKQDNINELRQYIDKLKNDIEEIINKLKNIESNMEKYFNISSKYISNTKNRNYETLKNINEFIKYNNTIIKDIKEIINDFNINNKFKNLMNIYENINNNNYIIAEINIKEDDINKDTRIINSYEQYKRENVYDREYDNKYENENEIKESCSIKINNELIPFSYFHKFKKEGKYQIKYSFKKYITKTVFLFLRCKSLEKIDLSNFNTLNTTNMNAMFYECPSLKDINLSNFNTQNVMDMGCMFDGCSALKKINLYSFNTQNVSNMSSMFKGCKSLEDINLTNFNIENVTNMSNMFYGCTSLFIKF